VREAARPSLRSDSTRFTTVGPLQRPARDAASNGASITSDPSQPVLLLRECHDAVHVGRRVRTRERHHRKLFSDCATKALSSHQKISEKSPTSAGGGTEALDYLDHWLGAAARVVLGHTLRSLANRVRGSKGGGACTASTPANTAAARPNPRQPTRRHARRELAPRAGTPVATPQL